MSANATPKPARRELARRVGAVVVAALIIAFALVNRGDVGVNWILGTFSTSLIVVIGVSFLLGGAGGYLLRGRRGARRRER